VEARRSGRKEWIVDGLLRCGAQFGCYENHTVRSIGSVTLKSDTTLDYLDLRDLVEFKSGNLVTGKPHSIYDIEEWQQRGAGR
jgi:hypothetical protein